jgi:polysaccharide deacetylase family protein (PEP-CTERM system associated)
MAARILNAFTVDLEDWFCVGNMGEIFPPSVWDEQELRVKDSASRVLDMLARRGVRATFFALGWIAERAPELIRRISDAGHEIGLHGHDHRRVTSMSRAEFEDDARRALDAVSRAAPKAVISGYRAPSFSIVRDTAWALDCLASLGLRYDSSIVPLSGHPDYGWKGARPDIHRLRSGLVEVPVTPCLGGGYFRLFPLALSEWIARRANKRGRPAIFYVHPWEFDPGQPRIALPLVKRFRHYVNIDKTESRAEELLGAFRFGSIREVLAENGF